MLSMFRRTKDRITATNDHLKDKNEEEEMNIPGTATNQFPTHSSLFSCSLVLRILKNFTMGSTLDGITLPIFILEPRSLLERLTDSFGYPYTVLYAARLTDPKERFLAVVKFYLSGWHLKPKGVKKPYWPVLGEFFRCQWKYRDHSQAFFIAEQVCSSSSSSPLSAYYYACPEHDLVVTGYLRPTSRFFGNSVVNNLQGQAFLYLTHQKDEERYEMTYPDIHVRDVIIGTMFTELGKAVTIVCPKTDIACEIEFKMKVIF